MDALRLALKLAVPMLAYVSLAGAAVVVFIWSGADLWVGLVAVASGLLGFGWYIDRKRTPRARRMCEDDTTRD